MLQEQQFPVTQYHTLTVNIAIDPDGAGAAHTNPGGEMADVDSGSATLTVAGQPSRSLSAGDNLSVEQGTVHALTNTGPGQLTVISIYVVERQSTATPAK